MKLHWADKNHCGFYLQYLEKIGGHKIVINALESLLDEEQTEASLTIHIQQLKNLIDSVDFNAMNTPTSAENHSDIKSNVLDSLWLIGFCYLKGFGVVQDLNSATKLFHKAANLGHSMAINHLGVCYETSLGVTKDLKRAVEYYQQAANLGYAAAMTNLGMCYHDGLGVNMDLECAAKLYQQAAELDHVAAITYLGLLYKDGIGVVQNLKRAAELFQQAADLGSPIAISNLGYFYHAGHGVEKDPERAVILYQQAANLGYSNAIKNLGVCYQQGFGVTQDLKRAAELYQQAADLGHAEAMNNLGICYEKGLGVTKDPECAAKLYQQAANLGYVIAIKNLGVCYQLGLGITQDLKCAAELYLQAAGLGYAGAMNNLGICYENGLGVTKDVKRAGLLYQMASRHGYAAACDDFVRLFESNNFSLPHLDNAIAYYSKQKDNKTLGFCYQLGLGVPRDLKQAMECYKLAIQEDKPCFWDLLLCYKTIARAGNNEILDGFKKKFMAEKFSVPHMECEKFMALAYLYERGGPNFDQNLQLALKCYQMARENTDYATEKVVQLGILTAYRADIKKMCDEANLYCSDITSLIAEYSFR